MLSHLAEGASLGGEDGHDGLRATETGRHADGLTGQHRAGVRLVPHQAHVLLSRQVNESLHFRLK